MKPIYIAMILGLAMVVPARAGDMALVSWSWAGADKGMTSVAVTDTLDIAILRDTEGAKDFQDKYGITFPANDAIFSTNAILGIFVGPAMGFRGIIHIRNRGKDEYTILLHDTGIQIEMAQPPEGKYWANAMMILVDKDVADGDLLFSTPTKGVIREFGNHGFPDFNFELHE
ncbi:MAG TPA: hypothetical protein PKE12_16020 [Kiritimatiellia bacterium]|nr:hypothetical protein [Kiritimatiellia bacterium]